MVVSAQRSTAAEALGGPQNGAYRPPSVGMNGVVSTAHGLAATAGLRILMEGGNAIDAAVAVGAALGVVEPFMSGLGGGGGFMLFHEGTTGQVYGLDYIGLPPAASDPTVFSSIEAISRDVRSSTVPGTLGGWLAALERFGTMDRAAVFKPAIGLAEGGWPITPFAAKQLSECEKALGRFESSRGEYLPQGRPPVNGEVVPRPNLARTYREVVEGGAETFYRGALAKRIATATQAAGGWLTEADFAAFAPKWVEPLSITYRGRTIQTLPPPSLGLQYLECLKILEAFDLPEIGHNSTEYLHLLLETIKLASADRTRWSREPNPVIQALISPEYSAARRALIDREQAQPSEGERYLPVKQGEVAPGDPARYARDHTTHFEVADRWGNIVAITQSLGAAFGSGFVAGDTGLVLNNFLYWTDLDPASPNYMAPGKPRESAMSPCIVSENGRPILGIGTPGSYGILQTTLQMLINKLDFGMNIQASIEAPRVRAFERTLVDAESRISADTLAGLRSRGHDINELEGWTWKVGGGHGVAIDPDSGVLTGGADPRRDGVSVAF
ncbi:MAG: gamma-glutamyltransferase [Chloroflexi bacterium]|nr:gamma-glutamyltransferase [Chloroflexota bacterium]